ncbi:aminoglycoside 6-adenylyltransferase [Alicyclobacillus curvatus]|nr:aminoglycoside 6-adenylyltransferase [Alicyclobacillus curvatus]
MRDETAMYDLILGIASHDERIRAVYMNGSRTNANVPEDIFQDFDIVYVVTDTATFVKDGRWIDVFGELVMMQEPDKNLERSGDGMDAYQSYGYLMLFKDGNRIDLHVQTKEAMVAEYGDDKLTVPLLDKDNCLPHIPAPTDVDYHVQPPTEQAFLGCTNNFWWCLQNVAKGIWRDELPYAKRMFEGIVRQDLDEMVSWWIGVQYNFDVSTGKMGKYFKRYLPGPYWEMYAATYSNSDYEAFWNSIFVACHLFRVLANDVGHQFTYSYPATHDENMTQYLSHVRTLPKDASSIT